MIVFKSDLMIDSASGLVVSSSGLDVVFHLTEDNEDSD